MSEELQSINLLVSGAVGVASSIVGAIIYHFLTKYSSRLSSKRSEKKLAKLKAELEELEELHSDTAKLIATCFADIFYVLFVFLMGMLVSRLDFFMFEAATLLSLSVWFSAMWLGLEAFKKVTKVKNFSSYKGKLELRIAEFDT
ncbi:TPA: hypothetical protein NJ077_004440 [Vibrio parahaemolyticus]|uniref:hypothetical protein n=1 Tax=Vibrio harveyi group TaxID=717610 RepID=UPI000C7D9AA9|nr:MULTISPECIES: hypothetical protein [Vibrio harveyi group]AWB00168.1 hypothetical protein CU052_13070 [Vibrio harveyi]EIV1894731.1 hypothetical protein [Vibrio parahaemolyticus]MDF4346837.1 hypothetical protein [Vibrio parahaemolyticus]TOC20242.1 hypothetical protein CGJ89_24210 [Vibrio parahaemolyticus]HCG6122931.1 hypothetical protein [Vibrio parahaemolyticus]